MTFFVTNSYVSNTMSKLNSDIINYFKLQQFNISVSSLHQTSQSLINAISAARLGWF